MNDIIYEYAIIGFGIAGQLVALELLEKNIPASSIVSIDPSWLGGSLKTEWSSVKSNTPWWKPRKALEAFTSTKATIAKGDSRYSPDTCFPVSGIADLQMDAVYSRLLKRACVKGSVTSVSRSDSSWTIKTSSSLEIRAKTLFFTQGGKPKELSLSLPTSPLSIALDPSSLQRTLSVEKDSSRVVVFGCSHSSTLVLKNLHDLSIKTTAIYKSEKPFCLESEGHYGGIKEQSAEIAKEILSGAYEPLLKLVSWSDPLEIHRVLTEATHCIYGIGFEPNSIPIIYEGKELSSADYDPATGKLLSVPDCYGFGLAYPSKIVVDGKEYSDVSSLSFQEHIRKCLVIL